MRRSMFRGYSKGWTLSALQSRPTEFCYGPSGLSQRCVGVYGPESRKQIETRGPDDSVWVWHESEVREVTGRGDASHLYRPIG